MREVGKDFLFKNSQEFRKITSCPRPPPWGLPGVAESLSYTLLRELALKVNTHSFMEFKNFP